MEVSTPTQPTLTTTTIHEASAAPLVDPLVEVDSKASSELMGSLRVEERELDSTADGYGRLWQNKPFTGVAVESDTSGDTPGGIYSEQEFKDGLEHGRYVEWYEYPN